MVKPKTAVTKLGKHFVTSEKMCRSMSERLSVISRINPNVSQCGIIEARRLLACI